VIYIIFCGSSLRLLRYQLQPLYVPSLGRHLLPLPKLAHAQVAALSAGLEGRGFNVRRGSGVGKLIALKGTLRIAIDGALGLASSRDDMLDALGPEIPALLLSRRPQSTYVGGDIAERYFSLKRSGASVELQFFPRVESLRTWTCLRRDGLCGLTPDEAAVLKLLLAKATDSSRLECVTSNPREGSKAIQLGRRLYYRSTITVADFLASLRTIESGGMESASYLPRDSVIELPRIRVDTRITADELGEWCRIG
jgi:hypothetical protein